MLENAMADDFLLVIAIKRQLGALKLKISADDSRRYQAIGGAVRVETERSTFAATILLSASIGVAGTAQAQRHAWCTAS